MVADSLYVQHILKEKEEKKNRERTGSVQMRRVGEILLAWQEIGLVFYLYKSSNWEKQNKAGDPWKIRKSQHPIGTVKVEKVGKDTAVLLEEMGTGNSC